MSMIATSSEPRWLRTIHPAVFGPMPGSSSSQPRSARADVGGACACSRVSAAARYAARCAGNRYRTVGSWRRLAAVDEAPAASLVPADSGLALQELRNRLTPRLVAEPPPAAADAPGKMAAVPAHGRGTGPGPRPCRARVGPVFLWGRGGEVAGGSGNSAWSRLVEGAGRVRAPPGEACGCSTADSLS